jgi:hypothetical protein
MITGLKTGESCKQKFKELDIFSVFLVCVGSFVLYEETL